MTSDVLQHQKRIMRIFILQGTLFFIGYCFFDVNTVIPIFIEKMTGRVELAGVANTIKQTSTLLFQIILGSYIIKVKNVPRYLSVIMSIGFALPLLLAIPLLAGAAGPDLALLTFIAVAIMWTTDGFVVVGYYDLLGRIVESGNRGKVLGLQQLIGGAGAMAGALVVKKILDLPQVPVNLKYAAIFAIGGIILLMASLTMSFTKDVPHRVPTPTYSLLEQLRKIPKCLRENSDFRKVLVCQAFFFIAMMSAPYILVMCMNRFHLPDTIISTLLNVQVFGAVVGGALSAFLAPKFGSKIVVTIYCVLIALSGATGILALSGIGSMNVLIFIMVMTSGLSTASWSAFMNVIIDVSPAGDTPIYMITNSIITFPLSAAALIGGQIIKHFGYYPLMAVSLGFSLLAVLMAIRLMSQKRTGYIGSEGV